MTGVHSLYLLLVKPSTVILLYFVFSLDNPEKENIPPDPGSGSKTTPIKEGVTDPSLSALGGASDSNGISRTVSPCLILIPNLPAINIDSSKLI